MPHLAAWGDFPGRFVAMRPFPGFIEPADAAEVLARIHRHLGDAALAESFAALGIVLGGSLAGRWSVAESGATVEIYRSPQGPWVGTTVASPRPAEVARWALRNVERSGTEGTWQGEILTREAGRADVSLRLVDASTLEVSATKGDFRSVTRWTRCPA